MGYKTSYFIGFSMLDGKSLEQITNEEFLKMIDIVNEKCNIHFYENGWTEDTWYKWREELEILSKDFPAYVFLLEGQGEEHDDHWEAIIWNGKSKVKNYDIIKPNLTLDMLQDGYKDPPIDYPVTTISKDTIITYLQKEMTEDEIKKITDLLSDEKMKNVAKYFANIVFEKINFAQDLKKAIEHVLNFQLEIEKMNDIQ